MPLTQILQHPAIGSAWIAAILLALAGHEFAHALAATRLGDATARDAGRLTLNPLAHVDLVGFLMLLLVGFGWGKPVPFDPRQLRAPRWGSVAVALAGPAANLLGVVACGLLLRLIATTGVLPTNNLLVVLLAFAFHINLVLLLFNLIPIPPLDGSRILLSALDRPRYDHLRFTLEARGPFLLLALIIVDSMLNGAILGAPFQRVLIWATGIF